MWAYVDESGNTGNRIFDPDQPLFITAAMATKTNFDLLYPAEIAAIARKVGTSALHANELGVARIEIVADDLARLIKKVDGRFFFSRLEKAYLAATKVYDTYFDQGENHAVPWHLYWLKPLKLMMTFKLAQSVVTEEIAQIVWNCLTAASEHTSKKFFVEGAAAMLVRLPLMPDASARQRLTEPLQWALDNPENFTTYSPDKLGRHGHSPNFVAFTNLMDGLETISKKWGKPVREIVHDEQLQFKQMLETWHEVYSRPSLADAEPYYWPGEREPYSISRAPGSTFRMTSEDQSPGLQVIDVMLWLFKRSLAGKDIGPKGAQLLTLAFKRGLQNDMSFRGVGVAADQQYRAIMEGTLTEEQEAGGQQMIKRNEEYRAKAVADYAAQKTAKRDR